MEMVTVMNDRNFVWNCVVFTHPNWKCNLAGVA